MDHNTLPAPQFELPKPQATTGKEALAPLEADQSTVAANERANMELPAAQATADPFAQHNAAQSVAGANPASAHSFIPGLAPVTPVVDDSISAEDNDLIEKAWVLKAKAIVEKTRENPYEQNRAINRVKKEYIKKRYQKDVKLSDEWACYDHFYYYPNGLLGYFDSGGRHLLYALS